MAAVMSGFARRFMSFVVVACVVLTLSFHGFFVASGYAEVSSSLDEADALVCRAFEAVLEAEVAGANVSVLIAELDEAGAFLARADILRRNGNVDEAVSLADQAVAIASDVEGEASELRSSALVNSQNVLQLSLIFSVAGASVFLLVLFFVWRWFRRVYVRKLLRMKPEVV
jgi:CHASE3 domain sensor protein